ncbi:MAG: alpha/beta hydrolase-fold protein [Chloroflexota bacterium]
MSELLKRLKVESNPLIDDDEVLFVWEGETAPYLHLETNQFQAVEMQRIEPDVWTYQIQLPPEAYIEYNFATEANDPDTIVIDPHNTNVADTGVGHDNHYFKMPHRVHTPYIMERYGIQKGTITDHTINFGLFGSNHERDVWLYQPATDEPVPLLVVLDGKDYMERGKLVTIVDNMIDDGKIQPIALAMIDNAYEHRMIEYNQNETIPVLLHNTLLPLAQKHLNLLDVKDNPSAYGILGASMGGLMALYIGLRMPDIFGKVITQAGAFFTYDDGREALIHVLVDLLPTAPLNIWLDCGIYDFLYDFNRDMRQRLANKGYEVSYAEHAGGHNYTSWRDLLPNALETLFGV